MFTMIGREGNFLLARDGGPGVRRILDWMGVSGDVPLGTTGPRSGPVTEELSRLAAQFPDTVELRTTGRLSWGFAFPDSGAARRFRDDCLAAGLLLLHPMTEREAEVLISPPISSTDDEIDLGLSIILSVLLGDTTK